jgi:hypothetical protein
MKKTLLSLAVVAGFAASAQTNSDFSQNVNVANGYRYEYSNTSSNLSSSVNCADDANIHNIYSGTGYSMSVDSLEGANGALKIDMLGTGGQTVIKFYEGNCSNLDGSPVDISGATNKILKARIKCSKNADNILIYPVGSIDDQLVEYTKSASGLWSSGNSLVQDKWTVIEWGLDTLTDGNGNDLDLTKLVGYAISPRNGADYFDGTLYVDWLIVGDATPIENSINEFVAQGFNIFPNPSSDVLNIKFDANSETSVNLVDITGKIVATQNAQAGAVTTAFQIADLNAGIYFVNVKSANGSATQKVVIK